MSATLMPLLAFVLPGGLRLVGFSLFAIFHCWQVSLFFLYEFKKYKVV
jgi:hypothetical protein